MEDPFQGDEWERFVAHTRKEAVEKIAGSGAVVSIVPDEVDIKFAIELGVAIMMDKPIIAVLSPGREMSEKLKRVCDEIVEVDIDLQEGRDELMVAIGRIISDV